MICIDQLVEMNGSVRNTALPTHHSHIYTITCVRVNDRVHQECMCCWWWWSQFNIKILVLIFQTEICSSALTHTLPRLLRNLSYLLYKSNDRLGLTPKQAATWDWEYEAHACDDNRIGNHIVVILLMLYDLLSLSVSLPLNTRIFLAFVFANDVCTLHKKYRDIIYVNWQMRIINALIRILHEAGKRRSLFYKLGYWKIMHILIAAATRPSHLAFSMRFYAGVLSFLAQQCIVHHKSQGF